MDYPKVVHTVIPDPSITRCPYDCKPEMACHAFFFSILHDSRAPRMGSIGSAGWDLCCREQVTLQPNAQPLTVETGWALGFSGCGLCNGSLESRSGFALSHNVIVKNSGPLELCSPETESSFNQHFALFRKQCHGRVYRLSVVLINYGSQPLLLAAGSRVAQLIVSHPHLKTGMISNSRNSRKSRRVEYDYQTVKVIASAATPKPYNRAFLAHISSGDDLYVLPPLSNVMIDTHFVVPWTQCHRLSSYAEVYPSDIFALCFEHLNLFIFHGIIDSDYRDTVKVLLINSGKRAFKIPSHQELAVLRLSEKVTLPPDSVWIWHHSGYHCNLFSAAPNVGRDEPASERTGGFGSTGN